MESDSQESSAIQITRQWMSLIEDYRYLLQKFNSSCNCHLKFDNTFFLKSMEQRYDTLKSISEENPYLNDALNDCNDWTAIDDIWKKRALNNHNKIILPVKEEPPELFRRITVVNEPTNFHEDVLDEVEEPECSSNEKPSLPAKAFRCDYKDCHFTALHTTTINKHRETHIAGIRVNGKPTEDTIYQICNDCGKEFHNAVQLENHIQNIHVNVRTFKCDYPECKYSSKFRSCFRDHVARHSTRKVHACTWDNECKKEFRTRRDLLAHVNFHHNKVRRHICPYANCGQSFKDSNRLKHHMFIHTGERPYLCTHPGCDASFKQVPHLKKHRRTHEKEFTSYEIFDDMREAEVEEDEHSLMICPGENCGQAFTGSKDFNHHVVENHPNMGAIYSCSETGCGYLFLSIEDMTKHHEEMHEHFQESLIHDTLNATESIAE